MDSSLRPTGPSGDPTAVAEIVVSALQQIGATQIEANRQIAESQAETERHRLDFERARLDQNGAIAKRGMWMDFTFKGAGLALLSFVIGAGFWTNNMALVTHALTLVVGMVAGAGLAKLQK